LRHRAGVAIPVMPPGRVLNVRSSKLKDISDTVDAPGAWEATKYR
jgi:hypothetical protein